MDMFTTPDQLEEFFKKNDRIKFSAKVFYVLQFVENYPDYQNECGAAWCSDGIHFISNSSLLGKILSIKPNTINTNFRSHSFLMVPQKTSELSSQFPNLTDIRNWKKRVNQRYRFSNQSEVDEINRIPCQPLLGIKGQRSRIYDQNYTPNVMILPLTISYPAQPINDNRSQKVENDFLYNVPQQTRNILSDDQGSLLNTVFLMNKIDDLEKSRSLVLSATNEWIQIAGEVTRTDPQNIIDAIMECYGAKYDTLQLKSNVTYLLLSQANESTQPIDDSDDDDGLSFDQFFDFFLRYGSISRAAFNINDLTQKKIDQIHQSDQSDFYSSSYQEQEDIFSILDMMQTPSFLSSYFCQWFQPSFNNSVSKKLLENQPVNTWLLRPSSIPCKFTIHFKSRKSISATYIDFDPLCAQGELAFSIMTKEKGLIQAKSLRDILFGELALDENSCISFDRPKKKIDLSDSPIFLSPLPVDLSSSQQIY